MILDRSHLYGDALFETVRVEEGGAVALDRHIDRFSKSARALGFPGPTIIAGVAALHALGEAEPGIHRVTISRDDPDAPLPGIGGITTTVRPLVDPVRPRLRLLRDFYFPDDELAEHKTTSYIRHIEARRRAIAMGGDDALLISPDELVGEASTSNIFIDFPSGLSTPEVRGILPGVTRARIIERFDVLVRPIKVHELELAREIILTNAAQIAVAALDLDGRSLSHHRALDFIEELSE